MRKALDARYWGDDAHWSQSVLGGDGAVYRLVIWVHDVDDSLSGSPKVGEDALDVWSDVEKVSE